MTFEEVLNQAIAMLERQGRLSYRALKRQFDLDDDYLADLKVEIVEVHQVAVDQDGKMLIFEDVPADVCQQCGETYFRPNVFEIMDTIVISDMEPKTKVAVPVFSMADTAQ